MSVQKSVSKSLWIKWLLTFLIPAAMFLIPTNEDFSSDMRLFLAITLFGILLMAFEFFNQMIPAMFLPFAYVLSGLATMAEAFEGWTITLIYMIIGAYVLANVMDETGLLKRVAYWAILKTGSSFKGLLWGFFLASCLVTFITFGNAVVVIGALAFGICKALDLKPNSKEAVAITLVATFAGVSSRVFFYSPVLIGLLAPLSQNILGPDYSINWYHQMAYNWSHMLVLIIMMCFVVKFYKPSKELNSQEFFEREYKALGKLSLAEKKTICVVALILVFLLTNPIHHIDCNWAFIIFPWLLYMPGIRVGSTESIQKVDLTMISFIVACYGIGTVAANLGFGDMINKYFMPLMIDAGAYTGSIIVYILTILLNFVMTPYAIMSAITEPFTQIAVSLGINPMAWHMAIVHGCDQVLFAYEYPYYLVILGFGMCNTMNFLKAYVVKMIVGIAVFCLVTVPVWFLLGMI